MLCLQDRGGEWTGDGGVELRAEVDRLGEEARRVEQVGLFLLIDLGLAARLDPFGEALGVVRLLAVLGGLLLPVDVVGLDERIRVLVDPLSGADETGDEVLDRGRLRRILDDAAGGEEVDVRRDEVLQRDEFDGAGCSSMYGGRNTS